MIKLSDRDFDAFQEALDWRCALRLPDGRLLGSDQHGNVEELNSRIVGVVKEQLEPAGKTILEVGPCEGLYTVQLAAICKRVVSVEVRPSNIVATLTRLFVHDVENVKVVLGDVRELDPALGTFDLCFHSGVLYHLADPVGHLHAIAPLAPQLLLNTHYCEDDTDLPRDDVEYGGRRWEAYRHGEGGWKESFSGMDDLSRWLRKEALLECLASAGYDRVEIIYTYRLGPHRRLTLVAERTRD